MNKKQSETSLANEEIKRVKGLGCLKDKRYDDVFNVRVMTGNGKITAEKLRIIADAAEQFGSGEVSVTTRLSIEIQGVSYTNIDPLIEYLQKHGIETGGTGAKVRPVVSCKGTTCSYGLIDTYSLSKKIHERFYQGFHDIVLPHKFKIAVGGCPNNCIKPTLNDIGVIGQILPIVDANLCRGCASCKVKKGCPMNAAKLVDKRLVIDDAVCTRCGQCVKNCPFDAVSAKKTGYTITIGGRWGKKTSSGKALPQIFESEEEVLSVIERAILLFKEEGKTGERFTETIERLGFSYVEDKLTKPRP